MDAIRNYLDSLFRTLPDSAEVRRARAELIQMSEDRYRELRAEGVSDNEAVGRVITQFGNLDDLADDLGIRNEVDGLLPVDDAVEFSADEAERFLAVRRNGSLLIAGGVVAVLAGASSLIALGDAAVFSLRDATPIGLAGLFIGVALGVLCFIVGGISMSRYDRLENRHVRLEGQVAAHYLSVRERELTGFIAAIAGGVLGIIIATGAFVVTASATGDALPSWVVGCYLLAVGLGIAPLIIGGMRRGALDQLTLQGDHEPTQREEQSLIGRIAGPYWTLAALIYLGWSFIGHAWATSWIVWPIAGVLFAFVAATVVAFSKQR